MASSRQRFIRVSVGVCVEYPRVFEFCPRVQCCCAVSSPIAGSFVVCPCVRQQVCSLSPRQAFTVTPSRVCISLYAPTFCMHAQHQLLPEPTLLTIQRRCQITCPLLHVHCQTFQRVGWSIMTQMASTQQSACIPINMTTKSARYQTCKNLTLLRTSAQIYISFPGGVPLAPVTVALGIVSLMRCSRYSPCETGGQEALSEPCAANAA